MARLIDADSIKYEKRTECFGHGEFFEVQKVYKEDIDKMPTVDAIPVSWLKEKLVGHPEISYATSDGIIAVLHLWEERKDND